MKNGKQQQADFSSRKVCFVTRHIWYMEQISGHDMLKQVIKLGNFTNSHNSQTLLSKCLVKKVLFVTIISIKCPFFSAKCCLNLPLYPWMSKKFLKLLIYLRLSSNNSWYFFKIPTKAKLIVLVVKFKIKFPYIFGVKFYNSLFLFKCLMSHTLNIFSDPHHFYLKNFVIYWISYQLLHWEYKYAWSDKCGWCNVYSSNAQWILIYFLRYKEPDYLRDNCSLHI